MGLYDEAEFRHERQTWKGLLAGSPGTVALWCRTSGNYSAEFAAEIDEVIGSGACAPAPE